MKKYIVAAMVILVAAVVLSLGGSARAASVMFGPWPGSSPDSGTCPGQFWAQDYYNRQFTLDDSIVQPTPQHPAIVREDFLDGVFVTLAGNNPPEASPGSCDGGIAHGTVDPYIQGEFSGYMLFTITRGTLNPAGCKVQGANCSDPGASSNSAAVQVFLQAIYGSNVVVSENVTFDLHYAACTTGMGLWQNASADVGGNAGDITGSASSQVNPNNPACPQPPPPTPSPTPKPPTPTPVPSTPTPTPTPPTTTPGLPNTGSDPHA